MPDDLHQMPHVTDTKCGFYLQEYQCLSREIEYRFKEISELEKYFVIAIATFYAWAFTVKTAPPQYVWLIPVVLTIAGFFRTAFYMYIIDQISIYMVEIEKKFDVFPCWEGRLQERRHRKGWVHLLFSLGGTSALFWMVALASSSLIAVFYERFRPLAS